MSCHIRPLPPPNLERIFTKEELAEHDGEKEDGTIYVAIKGIVFDVTAKKAMYGPSGGYHCFAGKDASKVKRHGHGYKLFAQTNRREYAEWDYHSIVLEQVP